MRIPANPVKRCFCFGNAPVVATEDQVPQRLIDLGLAMLLTDVAAHSQPCFQGGIRLPGGAANDGSPDAAVRMTVQQGPGQERTHGVAQDHIGKLGTFPAGLLKERICVVHGGVPPAMEVTGGISRGQGAAMAHVVFAYHQKALPVQKAGKGIVSGHILGDAVD